MPRDSSSSASPGRIRLRTPSPEAKRQKRQSKWGPEDEPQQAGFANGQQQPSAAAMQRLMASADLPRPRVYVGNLEPWVTEKEIMQIFSEFGTVTGIDMPREGNPPSSKGFCFVEFVDQAMASRAIASLQDFRLGRRSMRVGQPTLQRRPTQLPMPNLGLQLIPQGLPGDPMSPPVPFQGAAGSTSSGAPGAVALAAEGIAASIERKKLTISSVPREIREEDIRGIFQSFGMISKCDLLASAASSGAHCGTCVVEFAAEPAAVAALKAMQGFSIGGTTLNLRPGAHEPTSKEPAAPMQIRAARGDAADKASMEAWRIAVGAGSSLGPARTVLLENLVAPGEVDDELEEEVAEECGRFGTVVQVKIHTTKMGRQTVRVFVKFKDPEAGGRAMAGMNGRWFGGRQVKAGQYSTDAFEAGDFDMPA